MEQKIGGSRGKTAKLSRQNSKSAKQENVQNLQSSGSVSAETVFLFEFTNFDTNNKTATISHIKLFFVCIWLQLPMSLSQSV